MLRTYTRKAYLTRQAHANLDDFLNQARYLYNESLAERRDAWEEEKRSVTYLQQQTKLTKRREDPQWSRFSVRMQRSILRRLDRAYQSFFKRGGYPRFKSWRNGIHSFEDPTPAKVKRYRSDSVQRRFAVRRGEGGTGGTDASACQAPVCDGGGRAGGVGYSSSSGHRLGY